MILFCPVHARLPVGCCQGRSVCVATRSRPLSPHALAQRSALPCVSNHASLGRPRSTRVAVYGTTDGRCGSEFPGPSALDRADAPRHAALPFATARPPESRATIRRRPPQRLHSRTSISNLPPGIAPAPPTLRAADSSLGFARRAVRDRQGSCELSVLRV